MLSLIEVTCPHCGAHGQIMLPPVGTIIVGPCPECQGLVVVFCGHVLPLDKNIMLNGATQEKRDHMMTILTQFLTERIAQMITDETETPGDESVQTAEPESAPPQTATNPPARSGPSGPRPPISQEELAAFTAVELKLLDNQDYFKAVFG